MQDKHGLMLLALSALALSGCETFSEGTFNDVGKSVFGEVFNTAAASASVEVIQNTADSMCSQTNATCRNLTMVAMSGFTASFIDQLTKSDVRRMNDAREASIESGEAKSWSNPETGASGIVESKPAEPRPAQPQPVKVKKDRLKSLPPMDAVGQPYVVTNRGGVNVRGGPGTDYNIVDKLSVNEKVQAISRVREEDWYLVGRGGVGIGYVFGEMLERWTPPPDESLGTALEETGDTAATAADPGVAEVEIQLAAECFTTTQTVTLSNGQKEEAAITSCRTPDGWAQV